jgi:alpha-glucosidase (family GH31 glycosyl hydrolase)
MTPDDRSGISFAAGRAQIPVSAEICTSRITRLRVGEVDPHFSFLGYHDLAAASPKDLEKPDIGLRFVDETGCVEFCNGTGTTRLRLALAATGHSPRLRLRFEIVGEQHFYGLGHGGQGFDRLGTARRLWNAHVNHGPGSDIAIPLLLSHLGYGLFFDNPRFALIDSGRTHDRVSFDYECDGAGCDLYYLGGGTLRATLATAADLLGRAPLPPRWALGYMQSSRHFTGPDEVRGLAATLRDKHLPADAIIFLSTYSDGCGWNKAVGSLDFEPHLFPDPKGAIAGFRAMNLHAITHEYPVVHEDSEDHAEAVERGYLLDDGYERVVPARRPSDNFYEGQRFLDFSKPEAAAWWWEKHRHLVALGIAGWWLDGGEGPESASILNDPARDGLHNRFDLLRQQAFALGEANDNPGRRPFLLCRSGGPGMQRFGAGCWSGDINRTFATLEAQIALGLNMGLSGVPYWGTDIGGFYPVTPPNGELFARWFQFGAFTPVFRAHGWTWREHLPWSYGAEIEAICRKYLELRYRLMPLTYTLARTAHVDGLPLMRPLVLNYPDDAETWELGSQYLWGDDLLVAPVTRAGATDWPVYLPAGTWYDFWTGEACQGRRGVTVAAPLDRLPLFVRGGAILPMGPAVEHLTGYAPTLLTIRVYPAGETAFTVYEDDGETNDYRNGRFALTRFECRASPEAILFRIEAPEGEASVLPGGRSFALEIRAEKPPRSVVQVGLPAARQPAWRHDGRFIHLTVDGPPVEVRIVR